MKLIHPDAPNLVIEPKAEHAPAYIAEGWSEQPEADPKGK